jgi:hypothetical protein
MKFLIIMNILIFLKYYEWLADLNNFDIPLSLYFHWNIDLQFILTPSCLITTSGHRFKFIED